MARSQYATLPGGYATVGSLAQPEPGEALIQHGVNGDNLVLLFQRVERHKEGRRWIATTHLRTVICGQRPTPNGEDFHWVGTTSTVLTF